MTKKRVRTYFLRVSPKFLKVIETIMSKEGERYSSNFMKKVFREYFDAFDEPSHEKWMVAERKLTFLFKG